MNWEPQKICTDVGDYELIAEKLKNSWKCEQTSESWKWSVIHHGMIVASGQVNDMEEAKIRAKANVPDTRH